MQRVIIASLVVSTPREVVGLSNANLNRLEKLFTPLFSERTSGYEVKVGNVRLNGVCAGCERNEFLRPDGRLLCHVGKLNAQQAAFKIPLIQRRGAAGQSSRFVISAVVRKELYVVACNNVNLNK